MNTKEREQFINKTREWLKSSEGKEAIMNKWNKVQEEITKTEQDSCIDRDSLRNYMAI